MRARDWIGIPFLGALCFGSLLKDVFAIGQVQYVVSVYAAGSFPIAQVSNTATIYVDASDWPGVIRAVNDLQADIARVTNLKPAIHNNAGSFGDHVIIIGTLGKSRIIDNLVQSGKIDTSQIAGKWESFFLQVVPDPLPNVSSGLVIVGSDKRGTIYGIYDLSEQIGVSPWYWWADVPVQHKDTLLVKPGKYQQGEPAVKYRGIFLNDEAPDLTGWVAEKFGTAPPSGDPPVPANVANYGREFYARIFEVILRLKGNYLWPAMWNNAFNEDDPDNPRLADEFGIVMGTSHQEPMLRAQKEWDRRYQKTLGSWNYFKYPGILQDFWRQGIRRNRNYESIITIGLRGADDTPMIPGATVAQSMALLEEIVGVQRKMIAEEINPDVAGVPQLWCLYKEVLEYYNEGLRVPDDVTLLWADDNWGNIRRLPTEAERERPGGAGVYYHFDYVGGPRNYKWINTNPIPKVWEQMTLAKKYGADRIWIVNVGHFKGLEFPLEYFMHLAWNTSRWTHQNINEYTRLWTEREFGPAVAQDVADIISGYTRYNGRRKPELLEPTTYSLTNYQEADRVLADFKTLVAKAEEIYGKLPASARDAFYQLVLFPAKACAQVNELYITAGRNALYARQGRAATNDLAGDVEALFKADAALMDHYNHTLANGKWNHFMDQVHIGYTIWQDPPQNVMPQVTRIIVPQEAAMGVAVDGSTSFWPGTAPDPVLPRFDVFHQQRHYMDVFNRGQEPFQYTAAADRPWIVLSATQGTITKEERLWVTVDWRRAPAGSAGGSVKIAREGGENVTVRVEILNPRRSSLDRMGGFVEGEGYVSMEAEHYTRNIPSSQARWEKIEGYGRTLSAMAAMPGTAKSVTPPQESPCLEYNVYLFGSGDVTVGAVVAPTLNFVPGRGLRFAVSFDDQPPRIVDIVAPGFDARNGNREWEESVKDAGRMVRSTHTLSSAGNHTLKIWMADPAVVLQKIVVDLGGLKPSYLGPPESYRYSASTVRSTADLPIGTAESSSRGAGSFATGKYRNLFVEGGRSPQEVTARIDAAYQQLFHGDPDTQTVYYSAGNNGNGPLAYLSDINNNDVRSEGMSYGMMIAVQLNRKAEFDALWNWAKTYMYREEPGHPGRGFFSWSMRTDGTPNSEMPAPDGEEYFAMSLYFAAGRWGNGNGIYDYRAAADRLLTDMRHRETITGPTAQGVRTAGNMFHPLHAMVRFTPDTDFTDPSYHLPGFYELWARWGPVMDRSFWMQAATASRDFFQKVTHRATGLAPDHANFDGTLRGGERDHFQYDAWRTAMNWSVDWAWWGKDARERQLSDRLQAFFVSKGMADYGNRFTLDGIQLGKDHSTGLVAMNAVASLAATEPRARQFVDALWNLPVPSGRYRYYDGMLYLLAMLHCSGEFRIWPPRQQP
jgi:endo-1,4-beta-D-glucanase Y